MPLSRVVTIGVYGYDSAGFFAAVVDSRIDLLCDIRVRRGVRGRDYSFANAKRLEARLAELGIAYRHFPALAPTMEIRALQQAADRAQGTGKRSRGVLSPAFVDAYRRRLEEPAACAALAEIRAASAAPLLLCVERAPTACHRSIAAERLAAGSVPVRHLLP